VGPNPPANNYRVTLSLSKATTHADGELALPGASVGINDGYICFVSASDAITDVYTISSAVTGGKNIQNSDLGSTSVILDNVPGASIKVYMVANTGTIANLPAPVVGGSMTAYMTRNMDVRDQGLYTSVTTVGNADLEESGTPDLKTADIELYTDVAHIQIKNIKFEGDVSGKVAGIFINGYYPTMKLNGEGNSLTSSNIANDYDEENGSDIFPVALKTFVYDDIEGKVFEANATTPASVSPVTNDGVWGYNLFKSATPQIIIKLTDVVALGQNLLEDQFVTINGFRNSLTSAPITTLAGGMIYTINTDYLVIKYENMSIIPGVRPMQVDVTVVPVTWQETNVSPNI